jgi:hypothetical protein
MWATKGNCMNLTTRKTRACVLDTLDEELKEAIRAHAVKYGLDDIDWTGFETGSSIGETIPR